MKSKFSESNIFIITIYTGYPYGMAAARRIHLLAKSLNFANVLTSVIHVDTAGNPLSAPKSPSGCYEGVMYEYACKKTKRPSSFISRRFTSVIGVFRTCSMILKGGIYHSLKSIIIYERSAFHALLFHLLARIVSVRVIYDVVEWPDTFQSMSYISTFNYKLYMTFCLRHASALIAISTYIEKQLKLRYKKTNIVRVPILEDFSETPKRNPIFGKIILSISARYVSEIVFALSGIHDVVLNFPQVQFTITGGIKQQDILELCRLNNIGKNTSWVSQSIKCVGYVSESKLMDLYNSSHGALVSLLSDDRSNSRLPTKIAAYSAKAIPIIVGDTSDVHLYFKDKVDSFLYKPGDIKELANSIMCLLQAKDMGLEIGLNGFKTGVNFFSFKAHSQLLASILIPKRQTDE